jgi:hypothetical protein
MSRYPLPPHGPTAKSIEATKLTARVMQMRQQGVSFPNIARDLGIETRGEAFTQGYIYKLYKKGLKAIIYEDVTEARKQELLRLDAMELILDRELARHHYVISAGGIVRDIVDDEEGLPMKDAAGNLVTKRVKDSEPVMKLINQKLKIMERRARLLGLDAPTKVAATDPTGEKEAAIQFYIPQNGRDLATQE